MVWPENIDSGYPDFQLDTRSGGSRRNLDYLSRCNVTMAASPYAVAHGAPAMRNLAVNARVLTSVTVVAHTLQQAGIIKYTRGKIEPDHQP
jgi:hypothetical protein